MDQDGADMDLIDFFFPVLYNSESAVLKFIIVIVELSSSHSILSAFASCMLGLCCVI